MTMIRRVVLPLVAVLLFSCGQSLAAEKVSVFVSIVPQQYFVEKIGGDLVHVQVMVQPGASPATYEPKPKQMADLAKTQLYFTIGVPYENVWMEKISSANPEMKVIHTDHNIEKIAMAAHHHHEDEGEHHEDGHHDHEGEHHEDDHHDDGHHDDKEHHADAPKNEDHHDHDHEGLDPHIWLSPALVKVQAQTILAALQDADPDHKKVYEKNYNAFLDEIDQLDGELKEILSGKEGLQFIVFHPSWGYLAHDYGLKQVPIEVEGKDPKPAQLQKLIEHAKENMIKVVFVQPQFSTKSANVVAREINGQVVFVDPLAEDWMGNLRQVAEKFKAAVK